MPIVDYNGILIDTEQPGIAPEFRNQLLGLPAMSEDEIANIKNKANAKVREEASGIGRTYDEENTVAYRKEKESQSESRKRMDSGDPLARLGGTQKSQDRVARNIENQPKWVQDLAKIGINVTVDEEGNVKPGVGGKDVLDPDFNPKDSLDPTQGKEGSIIYDPTTGEISLPGQKPLGRIGTEPGYDGPLIYAGKTPLGDLLDGYDYKISNPFTSNPNTSMPTAGNVDDVLQLQQQGNIQSFDSVNKGGSFQFQQAKGRPFGQPDPETAFLTSDTTSFGQVDDQKQGGTTFRWA